MTRDGGSRLQADHERRRYFRRDDVKTIRMTPLVTGDAVAALLSNVANSVGKALSDAWEAYLNEDEARRSPWTRDGFGLLLDELPFAAYDAVLAALETNDVAALDDMLRRTLTAPPFQAELRRHLAEANITDANREQLEDGLDALVAGRFASAGALLILGVEGSLWHESLRRGLVCPGKGGKMIGIAADGTGRPVGGVEGLFEPLVVGETTSVFPRRQVYGGTGHPYRHARAVAGWQRQALMLTITLVTVLQRMHGIEEPVEPQPVVEPDLSNLITRAFGANPGSPGCPTG
jgi:hypothetical protein